VSAYISSDNHIDMSFSNPVLSDSADHFRVGIDDLTVNLKKSAVSIVDRTPSGRPTSHEVFSLGPRPPRRSNYGWPKKY